MIHSESGIKSPSDVLTISVNQSSRAAIIRRSDVIFLASFDWFILGGEAPPEKSIP